LTLGISYLSTGQLPPFRLAWQRQKDARVITKK
jgi:hypothetical protein